MDGKQLRDLYLENNIHFARRLTEAKLYEEPAKWLFIKGVFLPEFYDHLTWMFDNINIGAIKATKVGRRRIDISPYHFKKLDQNLIDVLRDPTVAHHYAALKGWFANSVLPKLKEKIGHETDSRRKGIISVVYDNPGTAYAPRKPDCVFDAFFYMPKENPEDKIGGDTIMEGDDVFTTVPFEKNSMLLTTGDITKALTPVKFAGRRFIAYRY